MGDHASGWRGQAVKDMNVGNSSAAGEPIRANRYPDWICAECGMKYGRHNPGMATWHTAPCDICGAYTAVTEPRDFGHLVGMEILTKSEKSK